MSPNLRTNYIQKFDSRFDDLDKLIKTPDIIKEQALSTMNKLNASVNLYPADKQTVERGIQALNNIQRGSIRNHYKVIYAQLCVLATSTMEALLKEYFANVISNVSNLNESNQRLDKIRISASDLVNQNLKYTSAFPKLILEKERNEFQNLKKLKELFKDYIDKDIDISELDEKKIIFYLECRHVIVHKGAIIDEDFVRNVTSYKQANLKDYSVGDEIELEAQDWNDIKTAYRKLVENVTRRSAE